MLLFVILQFGTVQLYVLVTLKSTILKLHSLVKLAFLIPKITRTCLAKQDQAGSYKCGLWLKYVKQFHQGV